MPTTRRDSTGRSFEFGALLVFLCVLPVAVLVVAYALGWPVPRGLIGVALSLCLIVGVLIAIRYGRQRSRWP